MYFVVNNRQSKMTKNKIYVVKYWWWWWQDSLLYLEQRLCYNSQQLHVYGTGALDDEGIDIELTICEIVKGYSPHIKL